jgi:hypothetical protein
MKLPRALGKRFSNEHGGINFIESCVCQNIFL